VGWTAKLSRIIDGSKFPSRLHRAPLVSGINLPLVLVSLLKAIINTTHNMSTASDLQSGQNLGHLLPPSWTQDIPRWFQEDTPSFDWAGFVVGEEEQEAWLLGKSGVRVSILDCKGRCAH